MNKIIKKNTSDTEKIKILLVEDEPIIGLEFREYLLNSGYDVPEVIISGEKVIAIFRYQMEKICRYDLLSGDLFLGSEPTEKDGPAAPRI